MLAGWHKIPLGQWFDQSRARAPFEGSPLLASVEYVLSVGGNWIKTNAYTVEQDTFYWLVRTPIAAYAFQRLAVVALEASLALAGAALLRTLLPESPDAVGALFAMVILNPGLVLVDLLGFHFSGFVLGVLLLAIYTVSSYRGPVPFGAVLLAVFVNLDATLSVSVVCTVAAALLALVSLGKVHTLGAIAALAAVFAAVWMPFKERAPAILSALNPLAGPATDMAPNFWALYNEASSLVAIALGDKTAKAHFAKAFSGSVDPRVAAAVLVILSVPVLWKSVVALGRLRQRSSASAAADSIVLLLHCAAVSAFVVFEFGWWANENAILAVALPLTILGARTPGFARGALVLNALTAYSMFMLVPRGLDIYLVQIVCWGLYLTFSSMVFASLHGSAAALSALEAVFVLAVPFLELYRFFLHRWLFGKLFPRGPGFLRDFYCELGLLYVFFRLYVNFQRFEHVPRFVEAEASQGPDSNTKTGVAVHHSSKDVSDQEEAERRAKVEVEQRAEEDRRLKEAAERSARCALDCACCWAVE